MIRSVREKKTRTVVVAGGSSGFGHMQAAGNLAEWLFDSGWTDNVKTINVFDFLSDSLRYVLEELWEFSSLHLRFLYRSLHHALITNTLLPSPIAQLFRKSAHNLESVFLENRVIVFVATHPAAAVLGSFLSQNFDFIFCVVPTDFVVHNFQVFPSVDYYYVPPDPSLVGRVPLSERFLRRSITTGIPLSKQFSIQGDTSLLRENLGLLPSRMTILVSFGCKGFAGDRNLNLLVGLAELQLPLQLLVVTGQNDCLRQQLEQRLSNRDSKRRIKILGRVENMAELMDASDVFMGKPGGLSTSEALAKGLPIAVLDLLPGIEDHNLSFIVRNGLGLKVESLTQLSHWIQSMIGTGHLEGLRRRIRIFGKPLSGQTIASHIMSVINDRNRLESNIPIFPPQSTSLPLLRGHTFPRRIRAIAGYSR